MNTEAEKQEQFRAVEEGFAPPVPVAPPALSPMVMLDRAVTSGASVEVLERLMGLQERHEANQARKAFNASMTSARADMPVILKAQEGHNYKYEDLAAIAKAIDPILSSHGLSYRWNTESNGEVKVTCVISHRDGHSESNSLTAPPDTTGSKNPIQALGSTVTYLQRYTLKAALGLSASKDTDAADVGSGGANQAVAITEDEAKAFRKMIADLDAVEKKICGHVNVERVEDMTTAQLKRATVALNSWATKQRGNSDA